MLSKTCFVGLAVAVILASQGLLNAAVVYDASLNTLPDAQGWSVFELGGNPTPTVSDGLLHQNAPAVNSVFSYFADTGVIDFDTSSAIVMDVDLRVTESGYHTFVSPNRFRTGYAFAVTDAKDRLFLVAIASGGVQMTSHSDWLLAYSTSFHSFDTTSAFHNYRLEIADGSAELYIDGSPVMTLGAGTAQSYPQPWTNTARFGDVSLSAGSVTDLRSASFGQVPEPTSLAIWSAIALGGLGLAYRRRRKMQTA